MPELNEIRMGNGKGKGYGSKYIYLSCPKCGNKRWVRYAIATKYNFIVPCHLVQCSGIPYSTNYHTLKTNYWNGISDLQIGMIKNSKELPDYNNKYDNTILHWDKCPKCNKLEWRLNEHVGHLCWDCSRKHNGEMNIAEKHGRWNGGKFADSRGYVWIRLRPQDPFYNMVNKYTKTLQEHRYVMSQILGRPLEKWEVVHHKGIRFPIDSKENKGDNLPDNLELMKNQSEHIPSIRIEQHIHSLEKRIKELETENLSLKQQLDKIKEGSF